MQTKKLNITCGETLTYHFNAFPKQIEKLQLTLKDLKISVNIGGWRSY